MGEWVIGLDDALQSLLVPSVELRDLIPSVESQREFSAEQFVQCCRHQAGRRCSAEAAIESAPMQDQVHIETVMFDYSGVLTTGFEVLLPIVERLGLDIEAFALGMSGAKTADPNHSWAKVERGELAIAAYAEMMESEVPGVSPLFLPDSPDNLMAALGLREDRLELVHEISAAGLNTAVVTNNVAEWRPLWLDGLGDVFDEVIDSSAVGCRKPEPEIYALALRRLGVADPASVVFIDDFESNIAGAHKAGMVGVHCTTDIDLRLALVEAGVAALAA